MNKLLKKLFTGLLCATLLLCSCNSSVRSNVEREFAQKLEKEIGAFEITAHHRNLARNNVEGLVPLDAGRGNPNWINTKSRYAFTRFMNFAISESERVMKDGDLAGQAKKEGIYDRFMAAMNENDEIDAFLINSFKYCIENLDSDKDDLLKEFVDGIIGDYYPFPSRSLVNVEKILNEYLQIALYNGVHLKETTQVFPTEGGTGAMVYIFNSLSHNRLLNPGDKIAISTPIFTPYLQIPSVFEYGLVSINIETTAADKWDISDEEISKLEDNSIKAFFLVNPSNPGAHALSPNTLNKLKKVIEKNPNLIIITDDVYGTFADKFQTVYSVLPHNTILVYSFSKLYGVTGWRTGLIAMNKNNVCDKLIKKLSEKEKKFIEFEYAKVTEDVHNFPFIERIVADSRSIGLYHTSGLQTPSQIFMSFMALTHILYNENDEYINDANELVRKRYTTLMNSLGLDATIEETNTKYYAIIDLYSLMKNKYGDKYLDWFMNKKTDLGFLDELAERKGVVMMYGPGFNAPNGTVRISLANLNEEDYVELGKRIFELLDEYSNDINK